MTWTRIVTPLVGEDHDEALLRTAGSMAAPFQANISVVYTAASSVNLMPWVGYETAGGLEMATGLVQQSASDGERASRARLAAYDYPFKAFEFAHGDHWEGLRVSSRFADVVVFDRSAARSASLLHDAFQQILMDERRPVLVSRRAVELSDPVAVAWDGGREASRAVRRAVPWLQKARDVLVLTAPAATPREVQPGRLIAYLTDQGVRARLVNLGARGDAGPLLLEAVQRLGVKLLVAGAFGHSRFQRFIFGGTTQILLDHERGPALFLSH